MALIISSALVLSNQADENDFGFLAFNNIVNVNSISATSEVLENPITNIANSATAYCWEAADTSTQTITINNATGSEIDYLAIARHNLDQLGLTLTIKFNGITVSPASSVSSNQAIIFVVASATPTTIEIIIEGATTAPKIAVLYAGLGLRLERKIYVGHTPINYGRDRTAINGISENGQYLGEIVVRETNSTSVNLKNLTPEWYRQSLDPFFAAKPRAPAFWAWRQTTYPDEVGYAWVEGNPRPVNQRSNGMMEINWQFRGIV